VIFISASYVLVSILSYGKQKYLGDLVVFASVAYFISKAVDTRAITLKKKLVILVLFIIAALSFIFILSSRYSAAGIEYDNVSQAIHRLSYWDEDHFMFKIFPERFVFPMAVFLKYFSNGLFGLSLSLQLPFEWTYLVGHSYSLTRVVELVFLNSGDIFNRTYPMRVSEAFGWDFSKWYTIFPWLAGDITFSGVFPLSFVFAYFYGRLWIFTLRVSNPIAGPFFIFLSLGLAFSYANNQIFHSLSGILVFFSLLVMYFLYHRVPYPPGIPNS
jgi:hypothetical protein